jgi:hypothetical protein
LDTLPSERVREIHSFIKLLKGLQKDIKYQWIPSHSCVVGNEIADYLAKKGTKISQTSACKLTFHSAELRIRRSIQADLSECCAIESRHKFLDRIVKNKNIFPDFPRGDDVATFHLITGHDCLVAHVHRFWIYPAPKVCFMQQY